MSRHIAPLVIPLGAIVAAAVIIFAISRVLLSFSREITPIVALSIALAILVICSLVAARVSANEDTA
jgi:hypothetical protein